MRGGPGCRREGQRRHRDEVLHGGSASGKPADASSFQPESAGCPCPAANAVDGSFDTRWAGDWAENLGATTSFDHVQLAWEAAYARAYTVQTSDNGQDWDAVHTESAGNGGIDDIQVTGNARYVRVSAFERGTPWGYSLYEFGVYRR